MQYNGKETRGPYVSLVASIEIACIMVGEQITAEQLVDRKVHNYDDI